MAFKHCVFTVMTPDLTLEETAAALAECGYDGVEWRVHTAPTKTSSERDYWNGNRATVDIGSLPDGAARVKALSDAHRLAVPALGTYLKPTELELIERCMRAAQVMNCPQIRVHVPSYDGSRDYNDLFTEAVGQYRKVEGLAAKSGVRANIELHMGTICPSAGLAHRFLSNFDPKYVGAIYDPGNMVHEGFENWQMGLELLGPYLAHVHVKNAGWYVESENDGISVWKPRPAAIREGQASWAEVLNALRKVGYDGWLSFEDFSEGDTRKKLAENIAFLKGLTPEV